MSFFRKHYEKVILGVLLCAFVILFTLQVIAIFRSSENNPAETIEKLSQKNGRRTRADYRKINFKESRYADPESEESPFVVRHWTANSEARTKLGLDLMTPPPLARCPHPRYSHLILLSSFPEAGQKEVLCPFCKETMLKPRYVSGAASGAKDTDNDGIPDADEIRLGLNPNYNDANEDMDGDGFTNYEEFIAGTDPKNAKSRPSYSKKLYVRDIVRQKLDFILQHFPESERDKPVDKWGIQIRILRNNGRWSDNYLKIGGRFPEDRGKYVIMAIHPSWGVDPKTELPVNHSELTVKRLSDGQLIRCRIGEDVVDPKQRVIFYCDISYQKHDFGCYVGETFKLGDLFHGEDEFVLVSADPAAYTARVKDAKTGRVEDIPSINSMSSSSGTGHGGSANSDQPDMRQVPAPNPGMRQRQPSGSRRNQNGRMNPDMF